MGRITDIKYTYCNKFNFVGLPWQAKATVVAFVAADLTIMKGVGGGFKLYYGGILNLILWPVHARLYFKVQFKRDPL